MQAEGRSLPVKLEDNQAAIVSCREQIELRMSSQDPETIVFATECLYGGSLAHVPYSDSLVLGDRQDQLVFRVEESGRNAVMRIQQWYDDVLRPAHLLKCPLHVSTSQAFVSDIRHNLI